MYLTHRFSYHHIISILICFAVFVDICEARRGGRRGGARGGGYRRSPRVRVYGYGSGSRYGSDNSTSGSRYGSRNSANSTSGSRYGSGNSDNSTSGSRYGSGNWENSLFGSRHGSGNSGNSENSLFGSRHGSGNSGNSDNSPSGSNSANLAFNITFGVVGAIIVLAGIIFPCYICRQHDEIEEHSADASATEDKSNQGKTATITTNDHAPQGLQHTTHPDYGATSKER